MVRRTEEEQFAYLKRVMPIAAVCLTVATFIIIRLAGHPVDKALLIAGIMLGFVLLNWLMRVLLGPQGYIVAIAALGLLGWRLQHSGLL
ncbi:hypothetical protein [Roseovarius sp.]|uniref:hypothetical protein n=1 Tax=Roseovarius sp. TaxID=1486281 RepID=UPI0026164986|nr:hypothetical protein [Roseovarius sp.]MDM8166942.1 hypothetical protein [Roseovarius sp.]